MKKLLILCAACLLFLFPVVANASIIVDSSYWIDGSRSTSTGGIIATDGWMESGSGFQIGWNISLSGTTYTYEYTISGVNETNLLGELSHWILEVTEPSYKDDFTVVRGTLSDDPPKLFTRDDQGGSNPYMPDDGIYGIKWEVQDSENGYVYTVEFTSELNPVWGDFYGKDGKPDDSDLFATARNTGFGSDPTSVAEFVNFIPTPNGGTEIPIPGTVLLLGSGLMGLVGFRRKKIAK